MARTIVDTHPHIVSQDIERYPPSPLFGVRSKWSSERTATAEDLLAEMDRAGVHKAAIVHASTVYGFDNALVADAAQRFPARCAGVGSVDLLASDAVPVAERWLAQGIVCFRIFTGGSTKKVDASSLDDPRSYGVWELMASRGLSMCINTDATGVPAIRALARRFPQVPVLVDHFAQANGLKDTAEPLFSMADILNIYLKLTSGVPRTFKKVGADGRGFIKQVVNAFGAHRIAWGSDWPNATGSLAEILAETQDVIAELPEKDQDLILGGTAMSVYKSLRGH
jgi:predicted TIM-barrel fold metal-dependent hydrolase